MSKNGYKCWDCEHWQIDGSEPHVGHCKLQSCDCATAVLLGKKPSYFLPKESTLDVKLPIVSRSFNNDRGYLMSTDELISASESRRRQSPTVLDVRELTDESKVVRRRDRAALRKKNRGTSNELS